MRCSSSSQISAVNKLAHTPRPNVFFFFNDTATTEIYTLSLHDALPICRRLNASNLFLSLILHLGNLFLIVQLHNETQKEIEIGRAVQQECRDRSRIPSSASKKTSPRSRAVGFFTPPPASPACSPACRTS